MLVYLLQHRTSQHNYSQSSPKLHLPHFHIDCESKQQICQMSFEHRLVVQRTDHSKMQSNFWIIYLAFLQPQFFNVFPPIGTEVIKTTIHLEKKK